MSAPSIDDLLPQLASAPPHTHALGFLYDGRDGERVRLRVPYRPDLIGDPASGVVAGGLVSTLLDHAGGLAVWAAMESFLPIATLDLRVDYMRAAEPGLDLMAEARCYRLTKFIAFVRAWAYDRDVADPVAAAQATYVLDSNGERKAGANLKDRQA